MTTCDLVERLRARGVAGGTRVAVAVAHDGHAALALPDGTREASVSLEEIATVEQQLGPRWVWWGRETADAFAAARLAVGRCWDVTTVHRLLAGVWRTDPARIWAWLHDLPLAGLPRTGQLDLLTAAPTEGGHPDDPVQPDGYLRPEWVDGSWAESASRRSSWAALALAAAALQEDRLATRPDPQRARSTAHSESVAEYLCAELERHGLPVDVARAEQLIAAAIGPRPASAVEEERLRRERDDAVLAHAPTGPRPDLRSPGEVRALLRRIGFDLPDTRAWRLKQHAGDHPLIAALLTWRKAERIATTYGYRWLDEHVRPSGRHAGFGRLRGEWSSCDGAAGRMTASAGLHNLPAELRPAIAAEPGHAFVHADLGQIEPRILAAVSGDPAFVAATADADLYQPVARRLGVAREQAKVGVLGAMYGGTTGSSGLALPRLRQEFPQAMATLEAAADVGRRGESVLTIGGRLVRMWGGDQLDDRGVGDLDRARQVAEARGRYARNALIQGAAAEFFKAWAVTFRARSRAAGLDAPIVLCLHDELLIHVADTDAPTAAALLDEALAEAAHRWSTATPGGTAVRFVAGVSVIARWSDAKH